MVHRLLSCFSFFYMLIGGKPSPLLRLRHRRVSKAQYFWFIVVDLFKFSFFISVNIIADRLQYVPAIRFRLWSFPAVMFWCGPLYAEIASVPLDPWQTKKEVCIGLYLGRAQTHPGPQKSRAAQYRSHCCIKMRAWRTVSFLNQIKGNTHYSLNLHGRLLLVMF